MTPCITPPGIFSRWNHLPLYWRILIALVIGLFTGLLRGPLNAMSELPEKEFLQFNAVVKFLVALSTFTLQILAALSKTILQLRCTRQCLRCSYLR